MFNAIRNTIIEGATHETICTNQLVLRFILRLVLRSLGEGGNLGEGGSLGEGGRSA